jgi:hypothetical protein
MGTVVAAVLIAIAAGALWRSPRRDLSFGEPAPHARLARWITVLALLASAAAWGMVLYMERQPNGPTPAANLGLIDRVIAVREGKDPVAWAYANGDLVRLALPDWRELSRVPARDLTFQTAAWNGRVLLVTFVDGRRGRAMVEGWGLLGDTGWLAPPTDAASAYGSLSAFWDPRDRLLYLAELGEYTDRGGGLSRSLSLSSVDEKGARTQVSSMVVHAVESRACRSAGELWLTGDQPKDACRVSDAVGPGGVHACDRPADAPAQGLLCAGVISNVVPGAVLAAEGRSAVLRPPASLVPDANVALRSTLRLLGGGGTLPEFTWWSASPDVVHGVRDGWLQFSARSVRGDPRGMAARLLDPAGHVVRTESDVFDMAQLPAHVFVVGEDGTSPASPERGRNQEVLAVGITPVLARFRLPALDRVDRPPPLERVRARLSGMGGPSHVIEGALAVLLVAPPLLLLALLCTGFAAGVAFAKRLSLVVLVAAPVLIELVQHLWAL